MTTNENEVVLKHLIDLRLVFSERDGKRWMTQEKIPGFGGKTANELIIEGYAEAVIEHIRRISDGGYA